MTTAHDHEPPAPEPADLVSAVDTVDELAWFVAIKSRQEAPT